MGLQSLAKAGLNGFLVVDKPLGVSSMDVVRRVRHAGGGVKTGHAGTLDPLATGVVICCLGQATRCVERLMSLTKVYETQLDLSAFTTTDDREGVRDEIAVQTPPNEGQITTVLEQFVGHIEQIPPIYSAIHVQGQRAYKLARRGETVQMPSRVVRIDVVQLISYDWPSLTLRITCGRGTYIRSIARDLGCRLGTGGHLASLRRLAVGQYGLSMAFDWASLKQGIGQSDLIQLTDQTQMG